MTRYHNQIVGLIFSLLLFSCGGKSQDNSERSGVVSEPIKKEIDPKAKGGNTCLLSYSEKLDALLTDELAIEATGLSAGGVEKKYQKVLKNPAHHSVMYAWKSDRTKKIDVLGRTIDVPVKEQVTLGGVQPMSLSYFEMSYRAPSEEQLKNVDQNVQDALDKKSGNKEVDSKVDELDKTGVDKKTQKNVAGSLTGMFAEVAKAFSEVGGIGDAASWNSYESKLYVLDDGVLVSLEFNVGSDESTNKEKAIALVKKLLAKCD